MKITIEGYDKVTVEDESNDLDIHDIIDLIQRALLAVGYHPESIKRGFEGKVEEYEAAEEMQENVE